MKKAVVLDGIRTPFGKFGGSLKDMSPTQLGVHTGTQLLAKHPALLEKIGAVFYGSVVPTDGQSIYLARHIGLGVRVPTPVPALTVNRLCGSGMEAVVQAAKAIGLEEIEIGLAGGVESMSQAPYAATGARWGNRLGPAVLDDLLLSGLTDNHVGLPMGRTAENLARDYSISRAEQDDWALTSQTRAEKARNSGRFAQEICPVPMPKGKPAFDVDEYIRGAEAGDGLGKLSPAFEKDGTVTAGNASGINDGGASLLIVSEDFASKNGHKPLARILGWGVAGCDPSRMGIGPVHAIPIALKMAGLSLEQMDIIEINEAFAAQTLAVMKGLKLDPKKTNINGGAIALGHPLGASGARLVLTLARELANGSGKYGVASLCIGGGQGIAMVLGV